VIAVASKERVTGERCGATCGVLSDMLANALAGAAGLAVLLAAAACEKPGSSGLSDGGYYAPPAARASAISAPSEPAIVADRPTLLGPVSVPYP